MAAVVFVVGIASRTQRSGLPLIDKYLGDALYAILFYLCWAIVWPNSSVRTRIVVTSVFVVCIELFQLTGIPLAMRQSDNKLAHFVSILLGTKFGWGDMLSYFVGIAGVAGLDLAFLKSNDKKIT